MSDKEAKVESDDPGEPRVVYRRAEPPDGEGSAPRPPIPAPSAGRELAPAVTPLVIGFTMLLIVICALGYHSFHRIDSVSNEVLDLEQHYASRIKFLLQMRLALTKLNNEARARQIAQAEKGFHKPFNMPLGTAREEMLKLRPMLDHSPLAADPQFIASRRSRCLCEDHRRRPSVFT
jgi:hypothetical protein